MTIPDTPRHEAKSKTTESLVIFLHGYGADGNDLIGLAPQLAEHLPETSFISPHAPEPCDQMPIGRQWFPLTMRDPSEYWRGVEKTGPYLDKLIDAEIDHYSIDPQKVALVGFSQGSMMAMHVGPRREQALGGILAYSGLLAGPEHLSSSAKTKPPVLLIHGQEDDVIPAAATQMSEQAFKEAGFSVNAHIISPLGHGIDMQGIMLGLGFLKEVLYN